MDSLRKLNISLDPHIRVLWIDNPNVRSYVRSTQVKSVPCIVVHDEDRDISIVYEKERFTDYLNNFIQQRQSRVGVPPSHGSVHGAQPVQPPHLAAMTGNPSFQAQHQRFVSSQQQMMNTLQKSHADLAAHQVQTLGVSAQPEAIRANISRQMFGSEEPPKPISQTGMRAMGQKIVDDAKQFQTANDTRIAQSLPKLKEEALRQTALQSQQTQQQIELQRQQLAQEYKQKQEESEKLAKMGLMAELRKMPQYSSLSDADMAVVVEEKTLMNEINKLEQIQQRLVNLRQLHSAAPENVAEVDKELQHIAHAKLALTQRRLQLPQVVKPNELRLVKREDKSLLQTTLERENYNDLQQEKIEADLSATKKAMQKSGTTSIDDLLGGEESLYDHHVKRKGTDFHQSEAQINTALSSTKRNSINQKVREMSQTRPIPVEKGVGHEQMAKSSMVIIPEKRPEVTPIDFLEEDDHSGLDVIDSGEVSEGPTISSALKKGKSSALDMAREMEKSRGMLEQEFERR